MNLHRADKPDWEGVKSLDLNFWQRIAKRTNGILAPASLVSLTGLILSIYGIYLLSADSAIKGSVLILLGRLLDILDGLVADFTKTKSPFGESVDATIDKIVLGLVLIAIISLDLIPLFVAITAALIGAYNTILGVHAKFNDQFSLHPSRLGKIANVFMWSAIIFYLVVEYQSHHMDQVNLLINVLAALSFCLFVITALYSSFDYTRDLIKQRNDR